MKYIYSTMTGDTEYSFYVQGGGDIPVAAKSILIKGGANAADPVRIITNEGATVTAIEDEDFVLLKDHPLFMTHEKNGFITVRDKNVDGAVAAAGMVLRDGSAPDTEGDYKPEDRPSVGRPRK